MSRLAWRESGGGGSAVGAEKGWRRCLEGGVGGWVCGRDVEVAVPMRWRRAGRLVMELLRKRMLEPGLRWFRALLWALKLLQAENFPPRRRSSAVGDGTDRLECALGQR